MKSKQLFYILACGLLVLCIALVGVAYETNSILGKQASKLAKLRADSDALDTLQTTLAKNKKDVAKYANLNTIAETVVPQDKDQAQAVRQIVDLASQSGITKISSITFPSSTLGATATGKINSSNLTQLTPVKGLTGVYGLPITITQDQSNEVSYSSFITFLQKLEQNRRTAQVSSITVQPDANHPSEVSFTLVLNEFIKP